MSGLRLRLSSPQVWLPIRLLSSRHVTFYPEVLSRRNMASSVGVKRGANHLSDSASNETKKSKPNGSITSFFGVPKSKTTPGENRTSSTASPAPKFDKEKWVAGLTPEQKELLKLEIDTLHESWLAHLKDVLVGNDFLNLKRFLKKEIDSGQKIFPPLEDVYSWSRHTPLNTVKAVILGQDPYHNHNQAHGLCFSVRPPTNAPPSLQNMYTALKNDYPSFQSPPNKGGLLTPWAENGVLMINACLTVRAHSPNSHKDKGWERFTQKVIDAVTRVRTHGVVFLAWGAAAGERVAKINKDKHCVLRSVHPSPLSARNGFFTCGHFKKANEWLEGRYGPDGVIDWSLTPKPTTVTSSKAVVNESSTTSDEKNAVVTETKTSIKEKVSEEETEETEEIEDLQKDGEKPN